MLTFLLHELFWEAYMTSLSYKDKGVHFTSKSSNGEGAVGRAQQQKFRQSFSTTEFKFPPSGVVWEITGKNSMKTKITQCLSTYGYMYEDYCVWW